MSLLNRRWSNKAWITCALDDRGRWRDVMAQRSWTELFFLDEAVAFAAGHRPCFACRRIAAETFRIAWARAQGFVTPPSSMGKSFAGAVGQVQVANRLAEVSLGRGFYTVGTVAEIDLIEI